MVTGDELDGHRLALWLVDGDSDWLVWGTARREGDHLVLDRNTEVPFPILPEWLERIEAVAEGELRRDVLEGADYLLKLWVGPLPDGTDTADFLPTGLRLVDGDS
jgi:hypothetical protein